MLEVKNLSVRYDKQIVLDDLNFVVPSNCFFGILGPNGSGKSTLLNVLLGFKKPLKGSVHFDFSSKKLLSDKIAFVPQSNTYDWDFPISVRQLIELSLLDRGNFWRFKAENYKEIVDQILIDLDIVDLQNRHISELSGGQKQRVLLARALVKDVDLVILDEPFNGVDFASEEKIISYLKNFLAKDKKHSVIVVHHNLNTVKKYFDSVLIINKKQIACGKTDSVFNKPNLKMAYGDLIFG